LIGSLADFTLDPDPAPASGRT